MSNRVVITGLGCISPLGLSVDELWHNCLQAQSVAAPIPTDWGNYAENKSPVWAPLPALNFRDWPISRVDQMQSDPYTLLGMAACFDALRDADIALEVRDRRHNTFSLKGINTHRGGVYLGTGIGGAHSFLQNYSFHLLSRSKRQLEELTSHTTLEPPFKEALARLTHPKRFNPFIVSMLMPNAAGAALGIKFALHGANVTHSVACAASTVAIGQAFKAIRAGELDLVLSGGSEYLSDPAGGFFHGFDVAGTLVHGELSADQLNRPFDTQHSGFLFSEGGAAIIVMESLEHAERRNAPIIAEVLGFAQTFDAHNMMSIGPDVSQIVRMMREALQDAGIDASEVDYINAHGTGTDKNDTMECAAIERVFGERVLVNSTKSLSGHLIGASGALETIVSALSLRDQRTHPCLNLDTPIAGLNFSHDNRARTIDTVLNQSFAFGGHNAALILRRLHS